MSDHPFLARRALLSRMALGALAMPASLLTAQNAAAAPSTNLWPRWQKFDPNNTASLDHNAWSAWLARYRIVGGDGVARVAYASVSTADRQILRNYIEELQTTAVSTLNRAEQEAFWANLYNALTVQLILDHYPVDSIHDIDISPGLFANGPWGKKLVEIEGEPVSLDDIEHRILRPIWQDPQVHYLVNCAAIGCPNLSGEAFTSARLPAMKQAAARAYVNNWRGVAEIDGALIVSKIYRWFDEDFGGRSGIIPYLKQFATADTAAILARHARIDGGRYDWRLNDYRA